MGTSRGTWRFARFRGVDLKVHYSLPLLAVYVFWVSLFRFESVAIGALGEPLPPLWDPWVFGIVLSAGLIFSVLLHELGHVSVALKQSVGVRSVTLMMLGGVSEMGEMPSKRYSELWLAVAGPLVSLLIALTLIGLSGLEFSSRYPNFKLIFVWLGSLNLGLGIFNLLPAFPLDGGRALRSMLAAKQGLIPATRTAVRVGSFFAAIFGILGLFSFNIFLLLIAFFLFGAGQAELFQLMSAAALKGMKVKDLSILTPFAVGGETLLEVSEKMVSTGYTELPVISETETDATKATTSLITIEQIRRVPREFRHVTLVQDVMGEPVPLLRPDQPLSEQISSLSSQPRGVLPVFFGSGKLGILRLSDVAHTLQLDSISPKVKGTNAEPPSKAA